MVGGYFTSRFSAVSLYCDDEIVRGTPGGTAQYKIGPNYSPGIYYTNKAKKLGYD